MCVFVWGGGGGGGGGGGEGGGGWGILFFIVCSSLVSELGVSNKHCLLTFLVFLGKH